MNAACYCHQMLALQLNRLLFLFVSFCTANLVIYLAHMGITTNIFYL